MNIQNLLSDLGQSALFPHLEKRSSAEKTHFSNQLALIANKWEGGPKKIEKKPIPFGETDCFPFYSTLNDPPQKKRSMVILFAAGLASRMQLNLPKILTPIAKNRTILDWIAQDMLQASPDTSLWIMSSTEGFSAVSSYVQSRSFPLKKIEIFSQGNYPFFSKQGGFILGKHPPIVEVPRGNGDVFSALAIAPFCTEKALQEVDYVHFVNCDLFLSEMVSTPLESALEQFQVDLTFQVFPRGKEPTLGVVQSQNTAARIYEYSEYLLPEKGGFANVGHYCMRAKTLQTLLNRPVHLPMHWAEKNHQGVEGYKGERFFFDIFPYLQKVLPVVFPKNQVYQSVKTVQDLSNIQKQIQDKVHLSPFD